MASYTEINDIMTDTIDGAQRLRERVGVACLVAAYTIIAQNDTSAPWDQSLGAHELRLKWVNRLLTEFSTTVREIFSIAVAANAGVDQGLIINVNDNQLQTTINGFIDPMSVNL